MPRRASAPVDPSTIPDKPFFKIGEAARLCAVKPYVLRYWETEFHSIRPQKTRSSSASTGAKTLSCCSPYAICYTGSALPSKGARARLRELGHDEGPPPPVPPPEIDVETMRKIKQGLLDLIRLVEE